MKYILLFLLFISTSVSGQIRTILSIPKDSNTINLHLQRAKQVETSAHLFFAAGTISTIILYSLNQKTPLMFIVPLSFASTGMGLHIYSSHIEGKYSNEEQYENN
jgi:hypothetical protein